MDTFRVRLNCIDHYQSVPTDFDRHLQKDYNGQAASKQQLTLPVIRVFGATESGQKVCVHVHGALPYLFIEYDGPSALREVQSYNHRLRLSIDHALAVSYRRASSTGNVASVAHITLVKGVPFYGYHLGSRLFLKIYLLNPLYVNRLADLLRQGAVMNQPLQPFESHMQYIPQWMCDYNLFGCELMKCSKAMFRAPVPDSKGMERQLHAWHNQSISNDAISDEEKLPRQSYCTLEVDVCVQDIMNRLEIKPRDIHHDMLEKLDPFSNETKVVHSMAGLWEAETKRRKAQMGLTDHKSSPFPPEVLVTVSADPRDLTSGGWIHEREYRDKVQNLVRDEKSGNYAPQASTGLDDVRTALESVTDLFPANFSESVRTERDQLGLLGDSVNDSNSHPEVDESCVLKFQDDFEGQNSDYEQDDDLGEEDQEQDANFFLQDLNEDGSLSVRNFQSPTTMKVGEWNDSKDIQRTMLNTNGVANNMLDNGIRKAGDYHASHYDHFQIPFDFTSAKKSLTSSQPNPKRIPMDNHAETRKRRKLAEGKWEHPSCEGPGDNDDDTRNTTASRHDRRLGQNISTKNHRADKPSFETKRLNFPIVKNPHDSHTIERLSQRSRQPAASLYEHTKKLGWSDNDSSTQRRTEAVSDVTQPRGSRTTEKKLGQMTNMASMLRTSFVLSHQSRLLYLAVDPPKLSLPLSREKIPSLVYQDAYFGNEEDVPEHSREYAGREFRLKGSTVPFLPEFDATGQAIVLGNPGSLAPIVARQDVSSSYKYARQKCSLRTWEYGVPPPSRRELQSWVEGRRENATSGPAKTTTQPVTARSQIDGPTQKNKHGAKYSKRTNDSSVSYETQYMSLMSLELHVNTRGKLVPDPEQDEISCIFWCLQSDNKKSGDSDSAENSRQGILTVSEPSGLDRKIGQQTTAHVEGELSELDLITRLVDLVRDLDPDILTGFEVHGGSWGYIIERARFKYDYNLCDELSRVKSSAHGRYGKEADRWGFNHTSTIRVTGRHMINIWRAMRGELNLLQYTMENVVFHLLHRRIPHYAFEDLTSWFKSGNPRDLAKVVDYHLSRVQLDIKILEENELIPRTSEQARLLGVDFFSVFSRGSQFKVESLMFRIAKPENFILVSPSRKQVGQQNALECLPLVMEPQSAFYTSPVLVLDFQSLYPSVMIAYNYCYSTFLGRIVQWRGQNKMGFTDYLRESGLIAALEDHITIAPNGIMYAKPRARKSLLAKMLGEILETRVMVKSGMKNEKDDVQLQRLLNNRQLALKLIANVTYGYTSASFSGRMPCSEIADSIVQTGRETLEKSIALIHSVEKWGAEVVYGDTDSLFVHLKGRTRDEAFEIGREIADTITSMNPRPIKLKFEKVYQPCVLIAKKRYVGFKYESPTQKEAEFDAKGIEVIRRDGTPAEQKIEETATKMLFRTADLSEVKKYFQNQCMKIMRGKISIQDFCFAREVKLGTYSDKGPPPPGALISARRMLEDPRAEPQYGERVPYIVIAGAPGARLIDRCVAPEVLLHNDENELDAEYYISKNLIPPLERIFNLVGANVRQWYDEMPKFQRVRRMDNPLPTMGQELVIARKTLESYMNASSCVVCKCRLEGGIPVCDACMARPSESILVLRTKLKAAEARAVDLQKICRSCASLGFGDEVRCDSKDCPVFYSRTRHMAGLGNKTMALETITKLLESEDNTLEW